MFGCGLGAACVVDVGDEKTSVCCVEDGLVIPRSRYCKHVFFHKEEEIALYSLALNGYWREGCVLDGFETRALCDLVMEGLWVQIMSELWLCSEFLFKALSLNMSCF